ncbi:MAG TPA: PEP-CTERM sorting domain-containing protein [Phormidium sp.]
MAVKIFSKIAFAIAGLALSLTALDNQGAIAATLTYTFGGSSRLSFDDSTVTGAETEYIPLLDLNFVERGVTFTESDFQPFNSAGVLFSFGNFVGLNGRVEGVDQTCFAGLINSGVPAIIAQGECLFSVSFENYRNPGPLVEYTTEQYIQERSMRRGGPITYQRVVAATPVPEPSSLLGLGVIGLAGLLTKKLAS